jgi:hypothetical protein
MAGSPIRIAMDRGRSAIDSRTALREWKRRDDSLPQHVGVFVYFGSGEQYLYQIRDWLTPLAALAERVPVAIVVRDPRVALALTAMTPLPVLLARWLADIDR